MLLHATPFQREPSFNGKEVEIPVLGPVRQFVDPDRLMVVNSPCLSTDFIPVTFIVGSSRGDDLYVVTHGYGTGVLPLANEWGAKGMWSFPDRNIHQELNPQPLGYPVDEMNAITVAAAPRVKL